VLFKLQQLAVNNAARALQLPLRFTPFGVQRALLVGLMEQVFREALEDDEFAFLEGKWLKVEVRDLAACWYISYQQQRLVMAQQAPQLDVTFSGTLNDLVLIMARKEDPDTLFFQRRLSIEGDTELGLELKNLLDSIELESLPGIARQALEQLGELIKRVQAPSQQCAQVALAK